MPMKMLSRAVLDELGFINAGLLIESVSRWAFAWKTMFRLRKERCDPCFACAHVDVGSRLCDSERGRLIQFVLLPGWIECVS